MPRQLDGLPLNFGDTSVRRMVQTDIKVFHAYRSDSELARFQSWSVMSIEAATAFIKEMESLEELELGGWIQLAIADRKSNLLLGDLGLYVSEDEHLSEIGFTLSRQAQGFGHASRAVALAIRLLFELTTVSVVRAITDARNERSIRVLERSGFNRRGKQNADFKGESCIELVYEHKRSDALPFIQVD